MIRPALLTDVPTIVAMAERLALATHMPIVVDPGWSAAFVARLIEHADGLALVVVSPEGPSGMLLASIGHVSVSPARIAMEHGWWCDGAARGWGLRLLAAYEDWSRAKGCAAMRMSTAAEVADPQGPARLLSRRGFAVAEQAWIKVL